MSCRLSADDLKSKRINSMFAAFIRSTIKTVFLLCIDKILAINSDAHAYKQAGNGVTVTVIEAIGRRIRAADAELYTQESR